jgi:predicted RNA polymerase sigma factor
MTTGRAPSAPSPPSRDAEAARAYDAAIAGIGNAAERDFLRRRHEVLTGGG